ncbi:MAG TPA: hypothetical protein VGD43_12645, partial [Micromonospora sp.]
QRRRGGQVSGAALPGAAGSGRVPATARIDQAGLDQAGFALTGPGPVATASRPGGVPARDAAGRTDQRY